MHENLNDLLFFAEVARSGSITAAGRRLGVPKATVSRRLIKLEERIGAKLFVKTTRKIMLTELGETYFGRCARIAREIEDARLFLEAVTKRPKGTLRVTMPTDVGIHWLADLFVEFSRRHPEIAFDLDCSGRRVDVLGERIDVAIRGGVLADSSLVARRLCSLDWAIYASPAYLAQAGTPQAPEDLARHRFVLLEAHTHPAQLKLTRGRLTRSVPVSGSITVNSIGMVNELVRLGAGIGELPTRMGARDERDGKLVRVLPGWNRAPIDVYYIIPARKLLPMKTRLFIEALTRHLAGNGQRA
jgi:DNA-binding transcriptional LysR family regulator